MCRVLLLLLSCPSGILLASCCLLLLLPLWLVHHRAGGRPRALALAAREGLQPLQHLVTLADHDLQGGA